MVRQNQGIKQIRDHKTMREYCKYFKLTLEHIVELSMNRDQGYHLPAIYNQIIPPKSEATYVTPVREQGP